MESPESKWGFIATWALLISMQLESDTYTLVFAIFVFIVGVAVYLAYSPPGRKWVHEHIDGRAEQRRKRKLIKFIHSCHRKIDRIGQETRHYDLFKRSANSDRREIVLLRHRLNKMIVCYNLYVQAHEYLWKGEEKVPITTYVPHVD